MAYNTQNYRGFGHLPSSGILEPRKHVSETGCVSALGWEGLGAVAIANVHHGFKWSVESVEGEGEHVDFLPSLRRRPELDRPNHNTSAIYRIAFWSPSHNRHLSLSILALRELVGGL
jgi:hypothetical protein